MANHNPNTSGLMPNWSKENQPATKGRKPSGMTKYIKDNGLTHTDIKMLAKYILPLKEAQIKKLVNDDRAPMAVRIFARAIVKDMAKGKMTNIMMLFDRAYGKPKETVETLDNKPRVIITLPDNGRDPEPIPEDSE